MRDEAKFGRTGILGLFSFLWEGGLLLFLFSAICLVGHAPPLPFCTPHGLDADRLQVLFHKCNTYER